jgi:hypothetical protein
LGAICPAWLAESWISGHAECGEGTLLAEGPLAEIDNREELKAWLRKWPREVSVAFAARAALRALPVLQEARGGDFQGGFFADVVLPVFRATGVAWAAAKYPAQATEFRKPVSAARAASVAAYASSSSSHLRLPTSASAAASAAAYAAASAAASADTAAVAATTASSASSASADYALAFWSAVFIDAARVDEGATVSVIAGSPLWPEGEPDQLQSLWQDMKATLHAEGEDWQVWTIWYDDRLTGRVNDETRELAYVRIEEALWNQGPAVVNAEIKRLIEEHEPPQHDAVQLQARSSSAASMSAGVSLSVAEPTPAAPIENVPSAVSFGWSSKGTITVVAGAQNWPFLPFIGSNQDYGNRLEACRVLATDTARSVRSGKWNARSDYADTLDQYVAYLPKQPEEGNFLLADAKARIIRSMFAAEQDFLHAPIAAELKVLLEQHIGLRAYYPATEDFYDSVRSGHLERPLPIDAVEDFIRGVRDNTPTAFEPNVADTLQGVAQPVPTISSIDEMPPPGNAQPVPPRDPLGGNCSPQDSGVRLALSRESFLTRGAGADSSSG